MRKHSIENLTWKEVVWQRQFDLAAVWEAFSHLAALSPRGVLIWETRGKNGQITNLLGADRKYMGSIMEAQAVPVTTGTAQCLRAGRTKI